MKKVKDEVLVIQGSGGGSGKKQHTPVEEPNTLRSKVRARILDLVAYGPIKGLVNGLRSVYLDGTPVENADGTLNFQGITVTTREGYPDQTYIPGFRSVENTSEVNTEIKQATPVIRSMTNNDADAAAVTIQLASLYKQEDNGDTVGTTVEVFIDVRKDGGAWQQAVAYTFQGKTTAPYPKTFRVDLKPYGKGSFDLRVRRNTKESETSKLADKMTWTLLTEIIDRRFSHPNMAMVGIEVDSELFGAQMPARVYHMDLSITQVPSNWDPYTRAYTGIWDGTFKDSWHDNPAWAYYDLAMHPVIGAGLDVIDKWELYRIAQFCDELVPNGYGGMEPRFTINTVFADQEDATVALNTLATIFRGMTYWGSNTVVPVADMPENPVLTVGPSSVKDGDFARTGTSMRERHSVAIVMWNDPDDMGKAVPEIYEDPDSLAEFGWRETRVTAVACNSRGQARRMAMWILDSERYETQTLSYTGTTEHAFLRPGNIIEVADPFEQGARMSGRLLERSTNQVTLDKVPADAVAQVGGQWWLSVMLPDLTLSRHRVSSFDGDVVHLVDPLLTLPVVGAIWGLYSAGLQLPHYRVVSNSEDSATGMFQVTATEYDINKYSRVELGLILPERPISLLPNGPLPAPTNLEFKVYTYYAGTARQQGLLISFEPPSDVRIDSFVIDVKSPSDASYRTVYNGPGTSFDMTNAEAGQWTVRVRSTASTGKLSQWTARTVQISQLLLPTPPDSVNVAVATFSVTLTPLSAYTDAMWEFWRSLVPLTAQQIEANAQQLPTGQYLVDANLKPDTQYYYYVRGVNQYGKSNWFGVQAKTLNNFDDILEAVTEDIKEGILYQYFEEKIDTKAAQVAIEKANETVNGALAGVNQSITELNETVNQIGTTVQTGLADANTAIQGVKTQADGLRADLDASAVSVTGTLQGIMSDIGTLQSDTGTLKSTMTSVQGSIAAINTTTGTLRTDLTALQTNVSTQVSGLQAQLDAASSAREYNKLNAYTAGQFISVGRSLYQAKIAVPAKADGTNAPPNATYWRDAGSVVASADGLASRVSSAETAIGTINGTLTSQATEISGIKTTLNGKADASALTALTTRVTNAEGLLTSQGSAITSLTNNLAGKADASAVTALTTRVTAAEGALTSQGNAITSLTSSLGDTGGQNLVYNPSFDTANPTNPAIAEGWWYDSSSGSQTRVPSLVPSTLASGNAQRLDVTGLTSSTWARLYVQVAFRFKPVPGKTYTASVYMRGTAGLRILPQVYGTNDANTGTESWAGVRVDATESWTRLSITFTPGANTAKIYAAAVVYGGAGVSAGYIEADNYQIEEGTVATAWRDNGKASETAITANAAATNALTTRVSSAEGTISSQGSAITSLTNTVAGKADASALTALTTRVTAAEGVNTSQGDAITSLNNSLGGKADASALTALTTRVTAAEGVNTSQGTAITNLTNSVAGKADVSALNALTTRVTAAEGSIVSQGNSLTSVQATLGNIGGNGSNILPAEYTAFSSTLPAFATSGGTLTAEADPAAFNGYALKTVTTTTSTTSVNSLATGSTYAAANMAMGKKKWVVSFYAKASVDGHQVGTYLRTLNSAGASVNTGSGLLTLTTDWARYSVVLDTTGANFVGDKMYLVFQTNRSGVVGRVVWLDRVMVEPLIGENTSPSPFVLGNSFRQALANADATTALEARVTAAEGVNTSQSTSITNLNNSLSGKADSSALSALTSRVTAAEGTISSQGSAITNLTNSVASKADASALTALTTRVTAAEGSVTSQGSAITSLSNKLGSGVGNSPTMVYQTVFTDMANDQWVPISNLRSPTATFGTQQGSTNSAVMIFDGGPSIGHWWGESTRKVRFDPTRLYKLSARVKQVSIAASAPNTYLGLNCFAENGTTRINSAGADNISSAHYVLASGIKYPVGEWTEVVSYVRGHTSPTENGGAGAGTVADPKRLKAGTAWFSPMVIAGYSGLGGVLALDYYNIEDVTEQVQIDATASALTSLTTRVSNTEGILVNVAESLTALSTALNGKAEASALNALTTRVTAAEGVNTSQGSSITSLTASMNSIGGSGSNLLPAEYTAFTSTLPITSTNAAYTATVEADAAAFNGYALKVAANNATNSTMYFVPSAGATVGYAHANMGFKRGKYILSYYAKANVAGHTFSPFLSSINTAGARVNSNIVNQNQALTTDWVRYSAVIDMTSASHVGDLMILCWQLNVSLATGRIVWLDKIMIEPQVGNSVEPSAFVPGNSLRQAATLASAQQSLDTRVTAAEGSITSQGSAITNLNNSVANKADASALTALTTRVTAAEGVNTSQGNSITSLTSIVGQQPDNLVLKGTFEDGDIGPWTNSPTVVNVTAHPAYGKALQFYANSFCGITRNVVTRAGEEFDCSADVYNNYFTAGQWARLQMQFYDKNDVSIDYVTAFGVVAGSNGFQTYSGRITAPAGAVSARIVIRHEATTSTGRSLWCNIVIRRVTAADTANAAATSALTTRVTAAEGTITSQGSALTSLTNSVANKADASALTALTTRVTAAEGTLTSQGSSITSLSNSLSNVGGENLIYNPSFDTVDPAKSWLADGWTAGVIGTGATVTPSLVDSTLDPSGKAQRIDTTGLTTGSPETYAEIVPVSTRRAAASEGQTNVFSAYVRGTPGMYAQLYIQAVNSAGTALSTAAGVYVTLTSAWQRISLASAAFPANTVKSSIRVRLRSGTPTNGFMEVDRVQLEVGSVMSGWSDNGQVTAGATQANADATTALTTRVTNAEGSLTSQGSSITSLSATLGGISGNGSNLLPSQYSWLTSATLPTTNGSATTAVGVAVPGAISGFGYKMTSTSTSTGAYLMLCPLNTAASHNITLDAGTYIVSFWASSPSTATLRIRLYGVTTSNYSTQTVTLTPTRTRYSVTVTLAATATFAVLFYYNMSGISGTEVTVDSVMVERQIAGGTAPSTFSAGPTASEVSGLASAQSALDARVTAAEGVNTSQATSITNLNTSVAGKADSTALTALTTRVTAAEGTITSQGSSITNLTAGLNSIGGDNMLPNSSFETLASATMAEWWTTAGTTAGIVNSIVSSDLTQSSKAQRVDHTGIAVNGYLEVRGVNSASARLKVKAGASYVLSSWARGTPGMVFRQYISFYNAAGGGLGTPTSAGVLSDEYGRFTLNVVAPATAATCLVYAARIINSGTATAPLWMEVDNVQLQEGTVATAYTPGVEVGLAGAAAATSALGTRMTSAEGLITSQGSSITSLTNSLAGKADASALNSLTTRVTAAEGSITSQGNAVTALQTSLGNIGGTGSNLNPSEYSVFGPNAPTIGATSSGLTVSTVADGATLGGYALKFVSSNTTTTLACYLHSSNTVAAVGSFPMAYSPGKYIISFYAKANVAGRTIKAWLRALNSADAVVAPTAPTFTLTTDWVRYSAIMDLSNATTYSGSRMVFSLNPNNSGVSGTEIYLDRIMVEQQIGSNTTPSAFDGGTSYTQAQAQASAISSLDTRVTSAEGVNTAQATSISSLTTRMGSAESSITTTANSLASTNGTLSSMWAMKINTAVGGKRYVAGMGVSMVTAGGITQSEILFQADRFALINSASGAITVPFFIENGVTYIQSAMIKQATIVNAIIGADLTSAAYTTWGGPVMSINFNVGQIVTRHPTSVNTYSVMNQNGMYVVVNGVLRVRMGVW